MLAAFVALSLHPGTLKKAQDELDAVVGPHRLPEFEDKESLVYVNAIIMETLRWHTVTPFAAPHCTIADEELRGYFIPKGALLTSDLPCLQYPDNPHRVFRTVQRMVCDPTRSRVLLLTHRSHAGR